MRLKVLEHLENLTPVWKSVEIQLPSVSCLNNLERPCFVINLHTKALLHHPRKDFTIFGQMYQNVNNFQSMIGKTKENKYKKDLRGRCFVSTIVKIARLEYELAYYDFAVHRFNHYAMRTLTSVRLYFLI